MKNKIINSLAILIIIVFLPILIINIIFIVKSYTNKDAIPDVFGFKPFIVLSGSMEPTIMTGDIAIIKNVKKEELKVDDIIAFRKEKSVITHRIVEINNDEFVTKGDNNNAEDRFPVKFDDVEGVFVKRIPKLGDFAMFLQTTLGTITFVSIPFVAVLIVDISQRKKERQLQEQKQKELEKELLELRKEKVTK